MGRLDRIWKSQVEVRKDGQTRQDWEELGEGKYRWVDQIGFGKGSWR